MVIDAIAFKHIIENDPVNGLRFMKQLAGMVGNRLMQNYQMVSSMGSVDSILSFGSNQVSEVVPDVQCKEGNHFVIGFNVFRKSDILTVPCPIQ